MVTPANQTQIPVIQTSDKNIPQVQQNVNKVLRNLNDKITSLKTLVNQTEIIGEIKFASITLAQFQLIAGTGWILSNGQSCVNTAYSKLTGNNTVPNVTIGINAFIKVN